jgi:hypothetical protein
MNMRDYPRLGLWCLTPLSTIFLCLSVTLDSRDRRGHDHMVVGFRTTYAISGCHH